MNAKGRKIGVTIYEIAEHVGVSPAAVSSVLSNRQVERRIGAGTVERIQKAVREMGYVPNLAGRRLRAHRSMSRQFELAILTSYEAPLPLVNRALQLLQREVDSRTSEDTRYAVSIEMFHAGRLHEKPELLDANRYHGVIVTNTLPVDDAFLKNETLPYAAVVLGRSIPGFCCVLEESHVVGAWAAETLVDAGCKRPAVLHGRILTQATADRVNAFIETIRDRLGQDPSALVADDLSSAAGARALELFLAEAGDCDGIFSVTDSLAVGAYQALRSAGKRIPTDVAVVGVGDYEIAEFFDPPLTTAAGSNRAMVARAIPLLFEQLEKSGGTVGDVLVTPSVHVRTSTTGRSK